MPRNTTLNGTPVSAHARTRSKPAPPGETLDDDGGAIDRAARFELERRRPIAKLVRIRRRLHVDADAHDDGVETRARAGRLAQDARHLAPRPAEDEIVRPLQLD